MHAILVGGLPQRRQVFVRGVRKPVDGAIESVEAPVRDPADEVDIIQGFRLKLLSVRIGDQTGAQPKLGLGLAMELRNGRQGGDGCEKLTTVHVKSLSKSYRALYSVAKSKAMAPPRASRSKIAAPRR